MISYTLKNDKYSIKIPCLTYGTANFERAECEDNYFSFLDKYVELGGTCIDTARVYCEWVEGGADVSETVIGRWLKARGNRDKVIISTKGGHHDRETGESRLDRASLEHDLARSLECLGTDYVDIYFLHRDNTLIGDLEVYLFLLGLVRFLLVLFLLAADEGVDFLNVLELYSRHAF